ncbi:hypothetical protein B0H13DRAFT_2666927, partial [Mycena leptocephala]
RHGLVTAFCQSHVAIAISSSDHQPLVYAPSAPRRPTLLSALWHSWQLGSYFYNARSSPTRPRSHPVLRSHLAAHGSSSCVITSTFDYRVPSSQSLLASVITCGIVLSGKNCALKEVRIQLDLTILCSLICLRHRRSPHSPREPCAARPRTPNQKNGTNEKRDEPRCVTFLSFSFLSFSSPLFLALPIPPSCLLFLLTVLSSLPVPS